MKILSEAQTRHLLALASHNGERSAYPDLNLGTLWSLQKKGLVSVRGEPGSMAFPRNSIKWDLTDAGLLVALHHKTA
jgi:hypothetical protein